VQGAPIVYVVFWDWTSDHDNEAAYLTNFLSSVGGTGWLSVVTQYGGGNPATLYGGSWSDPTPIPDYPSMAQIQNEAIAAINHFGLGTSVNIQIVVALPIGHSSFDCYGCCGAHGPIDAHPSVTFTCLPYNPGPSCGQVNGPNGTLDPVSITEGHELAESITDPLGTSWYDANGPAHGEIGDKCQLWDLGNIPTSNGTFAVQSLWSNAINDCVLARGDRWLQYTGLNLNSSNGQYGDVVDMNGDGKPDLVWIPEGTSDWYVALSTGTSFAAPVRWLQYSGVFHLNSSNGLYGHIIDMNSDGKPDSVWIPEGSGDWYVALNQ
jgi:hypothetical protein